MLDTIRQWLNTGNKDYFTGVAIYEQCSPDAKLLAVLKDGPNDFRKKRLHEEILKAYKGESEKPESQKLQVQSKSPVVKNITQAAEKITPPANKFPSNAKNVIARGDTFPKGVTSDKAPVNPKLYDACMLEANNEYKKVMNARAILFKKAEADGFLDVNKPDLIFERGELALEVVKGWKNVSELYDRAEFVRTSGRLPDSDVIVENEYDHLPDAQVKQHLDNARKAYNKLKKKASTPERVALLQKHEANIQKLKAKWDSLQQKQ